MQRMDKDPLILEKEDVQANISLPPSIDQVMQHSQNVKKGVELSDHREHILRWMNELWNKWRGYLYVKYVKNNSLPQALKNMPNGIDKKEWEWLVKEHFSFKSFQAQIEEIVNAEPSLSSIEIVEKCFGPQNHRHVVAFGGGVKAKYLKGGTSTKVKLLSTLRSTQKENKYLNEENKSLNDH
ncbi:hypothetical protein T459_08237 [Capsicum annuum]|uniref:Uncharacterized protein n=1 Tax=Capsicum annuum TaxID=4072 RepID=A0A2G2ZVZ8_CAPAN|nr:hypothetical protein T459_08237 [Capsicum annuum]